MRVFDSQQHRKIRSVHHALFLHRAPAPQPRMLTTQACSHTGLHVAHEHPSSQVLDQPSRCSYYRAFADTRDDNGHGSHVAGTLAGLRAGASLATEVAQGGNSSAGMAPGAKLAVFGARRCASLPVAVCPQFGASGWA